MNHPAQPAPEGAVNYSEFDIPDGVVIGMPWPHTLVTWPGGKSRNATKVEHDLWQIAAKERARCERLEWALREIEKGEGAFSRDQLTFANNVIERSKEVARTTLAQPEDDESIREDMEQFVSEGPENEGDK